MVSISASYKESRCNDKGVKHCPPSLFQSEQGWPYLLPSQRKSFPQWQRDDDFAQIRRTWGETEGTREFLQVKWNTVLAIYSLKSLFWKPYSIVTYKNPSLTAASPQRKLSYFYWRKTISSNKNMRCMKVGMSSLFPVHIQGLEQSVTRRPSGNIYYVNKWINKWMELLFSCQKLFQYVLYINRFLNMECRNIRCFYSLVKNRALSLWIVLFKTAYFCLIWKFCLFSFMGEPGLSERQGFKCLRLHWIPSNTLCLSNIIFLATNTIFEYNCWIKDLTWCEQYVLIIIQHNKDIFPDYTWLTQQQTLEEISFHWRKTITWPQAHNYSVFFWW